MVLSFDEGDQYMTFLTNAEHALLVSNLQDGLILLLLGMGTVFVFLTLLVFLTKGMSSAVRKIAPKEQPAAASPIAETAAPSASNGAEIAAAIAAAFVQSKKK
jgi:oxaloacetate decarboxylase gamma subunit